MKKFIKHLDNPGTALSKAVELVVEWGCEIETDKQEKIIQRMMEHGFTRDEVSDKFGFSGHVNVKPSPSPSPDNSDDA